MALRGRKFPWQTEWETEEEARILGRDGETDISFVERGEETMARHCDGEGRVGGKERRARKQSV